MPVKDVKVDTLLKTYLDWQKRTNTFPPVLAVGGAERAFVDEAVEAVRKQVLSSGLADFNHDRLSARSTNLDKILAQANTLPVMASMRLVELHEAEAISADDLVALESYLKSPTKTTVLLFVFDQLDARQKMPKLLDQFAIVYKFDHPKDDQMHGLIRHRAQRFGLHIDDDAAALLTMTVGADVSMLERALEKLAIAVDGGRVSAREIGLHVTSTRVEDAFLLGRAVVLGDLKQASISLAKLKAAREVPLKLVGMLAWQLRQVLRARVMLDDRKSEQEISKTLVLYGDRLKPVMAAAKKNSTKMFASKLAALCELDLKLKSSRVPGWLWLERVVLQISAPLR